MYPGDHTVSILNRSNNPRFAKPDFLCPRPQAGGVQVSFDGALIVC